MNSKTLLLSVSMSLIAAAVTAAVGPGARSSVDAPRFLVQAASLDSARRDVASVGAPIEHDLAIVNSVSAHLYPWQAAQLRSMQGVRVFADRALRPSGLLNGLLSDTVSTVTSTVDDVASTALVTANQLPLVPAVTTPVVAAASGSTVPQDGTGVNTPTLLYQTNYPMLVGADTLQQAGITGRGVTIAMLDSGLWQAPSQNYGTRVLATIDVTNGGSGPVTGDPYGHGTHITSIAAGGAVNLSGSYLSIAPQANLVIVRAFNGEGGGSYVDVISGLNWIVANRAKYHIRVVNLSFGATPESYYWNDPLDQAVMAAWQAGIVVVVAAGNEGPNPMTIDVPGNVPYVITAGALTDNYTPYNLTDDRLASFSSAGPTYEGFVKPELIAPGGHMVASMSSQSYLANIDPGLDGADRADVHHVGNLDGRGRHHRRGRADAAIGSGALTPDQVKCRLLASARPAVELQRHACLQRFSAGRGSHQRGLGGG